MVLVIPMRGKSFTDEERANILALHQEGLSYYKIAIVLELLPNKVKYFLASPDDKKKISDKSNSYAKVNKTTAQRTAESNMKYRTNKKFRERRKKEAHDYYHNVLKPARELWKLNNHE